MTRGTFEPASRDVAAVTLDLLAVSGLLLGRVPVLLIKEMRRMLAYSDSGLYCTGADRAPAGSIGGAEAVEALADQVRRGLAPHVRALLQVFGN